MTGNIKTCTIKRENCNEWYVVFSVEEPKKKKPNHKNEKVIAYDLGVKHFAVSSDAEYIYNPKFYNSKLAELKKVQKKYSELKNKPKEDKTKQKVKTKLVKLHKKVKNQRKDFLHKLSREIVNEYKYVIVEDLHTKTMTRKNSYYKLNRYIMDCGWNQFTNMLEYKAEEAGGQVVKVNPRKTSQRCSNCGLDVPKDLNERKHKCYSCGIELDRDLNAAYNILSLGRQALGLSLDAARSLA
jgi:putative transposase